MNKTADIKHKDQHASPGLRAFQLALMVLALLTCLAGSPLSLAQTSSPTTAKSLVYIADSENERLNRRLRELLMDAFGESVMVRPFVPGQTSQDSESPVIAIGPTAFTTVRSENKRVPVLGLLVDEPYISRSQDDPDSQVSAVFSTPPLIRQVALGKAILPYSTLVAMLARPDTEHLYDSLIRDLEHLDMEGRVFLIPSDERLIPTLIRALDYGDFVLAASDDSVYNPRTIKHILLTSYRRNRIVIGPVQAYVKAGSLASTFTPLSAVAQMTADYVRHFWQSNAFPEPAHPNEFGIEINHQVGRSLNIPLPEREVLSDLVMQRLESAEALKNE